MAGSNSPIIWTPSIQAKSIANVTAGEWVQVELSYRSTNTTPVVIVPLHFMIHVLYTPDSDDSTNHPDTPTTYGGSPTSGNRRSLYRIDPGVCFQVPWKGQIFVAAGGNSNPDTCIVDVVVRRGFPPRELNNCGEPVDFELLALSDPVAAFEGVLDSTICPGPAWGKRIWWPPVVRHPRLVPATWINVVGNEVAPAIPTIQFPDGAELMEVVLGTGVPGDPATIVTLSMGNNLPVSMASGVRRSIAAFAQGGAAPGGSTALWIPDVGTTFTSATIWSSFGN